MSVQKDNPVGLDNVFYTIAVVAVVRLSRQDEKGVPPIGQRVVEIHVFVARNEQSRPRIRVVTGLVKSAFVFCRGIPQCIQDAVQIVQRLVGPEFGRDLKVGFGPCQKGRILVGGKFVVFGPSHDSHRVQVLSSLRHHVDFGNVNAQMVKVAKDHSRVLVDLASVLWASDGMIKALAFRRDIIHAVVFVGFLVRFPFHGTMFEFLAPHVAP